jgi:hypothetical protein
MNERSLNAVRIVRAREPDAIAASFIGDGDAIDGQPCLISPAMQRQATLPRWERASAKLHGSIPGTVSATNPSLVGEPR